MQSIQNQIPTAKCSMQSYLSVGILTVCMLVSSDTLAEGEAKTELSGKIEIEAIFTEDKNDAGISADLGVTHIFSDKVDAELTLSLDDEKIEIDEAMINYHPVEGTDATLGRFVLPFGSFSSEMVSSPLTQTIGKSTQDGLSVSTELGSVTGSAFIFDDRANDDENGIGSFGLSVVHETDDLTVGAGYISDAAETRVPGINIHAKTSLGMTTVIAEYIRLDEMDDGSKPSATHLEADFDLASDHILAVTYQMTDEAEGLGLPEKAAGIAYAMPVAENTTLTAEYMRTTGYDGKKDNIGTATLGYEFSIEGLDEINDE